MRFTGDEEIAVREQRIRATFVESVEEAGNRAEQFECAASS